MRKFPSSTATLFALCVALPAAAQQSVDVSKAGTTPQAHMAYVKSLPEAQQAKVFDACAEAAIAKPGAAPALIAFCQTVVNSGMPTLGVDISDAGNTKEEHAAFVKTLAPDDQKAVKTACAPVIATPSPQHPPAVLAFCKNMEL
jgi:hypothetical protein